MRHVWSVALCALSIGVSGVLQAQTIPSSFDYIETKHSIGVFGGYLQTDPGRRDVGIEPAPFAGLRYGIHLTGPLTGELSASYAPSKRTLYFRPNAADSTLTTAGDADVGLLLMQAGFRFNLTGPRTWKGFAPFVLATAGVVTDLTGMSSLEEEIDQDQRLDFGPGFAAGGGVGTDFFLTDWLSLRAEATDHLWRYEYPVGLVGSTQTESEWVQNFGFSIGGAFHF